MIDGTVYVTAAGSMIQDIEGALTYLGIQCRSGDSVPQFAMMTKGYESRSYHVNRFLESEHDFIFFADLDMTFAPGTLERLRAHGLPFVSGLYMKRKTNPVEPLWFREDMFSRWPLEPWTGPIERGRLHKIGACGWGCCLVHRSVFEAVAPLLKGEPFIIEDDMDVWPYDLAAVLRGDEQLLPLRGDKSGAVGSDVRFGFFARQAGVTIWGDPDVTPGHLISHPLSVGDYERGPPEMHDRVAGIVAERLFEARETWRERMAALGVEVMA